ncbi:hypothetical protein MKW94_020459 [Papaver nudicaule]|uniref:Cullin N-terminal domain-containing protein n=1 Tax=Papaver nudicaule TaxID=74823 RepID=A0AA41VPM3_PAPNU|nr:hypothetical protein [Papaver nudicaule]
METKIELEQGWGIIQKEISKMINILEGVPDSEPPVYGTIYSTIYTISRQKSPNDDSKELYHRYEGVYNDYLQSKVLPAIQEKTDDDVSMLQELIKRWATHKVMVTKLTRYFAYLDRYYIPRMKLPCLKDVGFGCFRDIVYEKMKVKVRDAVIALINQEREGTEINRSLVKDVVEIFVEIGNENGKDKLDYYVNDFETVFLADLVDYYTQKGCGITAVECLEKEKDRVSHYLHSSTEEKLLKQVQGQEVLPEDVQQDLEEKMQSHLTITN